MNMALKEKIEGAAGPRASVRVLVDAEIKRKAQEALALQGLTLSQAMRWTVISIAEQGGLPSGVEMFNAETRAAMREERGGPRARSVDELMRVLEKGD
jgi:addiction module RelB/DinJ family antitoxin